jgi:UDP-N-acetylmuramoyl-tripeptide--D-alanyl-D-alanine ligase
MTLWTSAEAQAATGGTAQGVWSCTGISIDTRTLEPGDLFVALKDVRDGHDFVANAWRPSRMWLVSPSKRHRCSKD